MNNLDERLEELSSFYEFNEIDQIKCFISKHEKLLDLLEIAKPNLSEVFPNADFEVEFYHDLCEGSHRLLVYVHADEVTFNNGFDGDLYKVFLEVFPFQKKFGLVLEFGLRAGFRYVS